MPEPKTLHINQPLSNFSVQYRNAAMIWPMVMPIVKVKKLSDAFFKYDKDERFRIPDNELGATAMPNEVDFSTSQDNYSCKGHGLGGWVSKESEENADSPLSPKLDETELQNELLDVAQEKRVSDIAFSPATYPAANKIQLSGTGQWGQSADAPINNILLGLDTAFLRPNTIVFGEAVWRIFRVLPEVLDAIGSSVGSAPRGGLASLKAVGDLFEVDNVLVGRAKYNTAKEGQAASYSKLWGNHVSLMHVKKSPSLKSVHFGNTFVESIKQTRTSFDEKRGVKGATFVKTTWNSDEKVVASDVAYFIEDAV